MWTQITERVYINGKVNVPLQDDAANINVVNKTTQKATITNEIGEFNIFVGVGDELSFSAIQYVEFSVKINQTIVDQKKMTVMLRESQNPLDEIVVKPYDLTGNIEVDAQRIKTTRTIDLSNATKEAINTMEGEYTKDRQSAESKAIASDQLIEYGLDVANIFRTIFKNINKKEKAELPQNFDVVVRKMYDDDFFNEYLNIEKNQINEFIFFVQDQKMDKSLLEKENQLDFIQYLVEKSNEFKGRLD